MTTLISATELLRTRSVLLSLLLIASLLSLGSAPNAAAACPGSDGSGSGVVFESCTEVKIDSNARFMDLPVPANTGQGDLLVAVLTTDGNELTGVPNGWLRTGLEEHSATTAIYYRYASANEGSSYRFQWGSDELAYGYMMRFSGAVLASSATSTGTSSTVTFPSADTFVADSMVLRVGGFDDDDLVIDPATIIPGHTNITADSSSTGTGTASGAAAYQRQAAIGPSGTASMSLTAVEEWAAFTLTLSPFNFTGSTFFNFLCPAANGSSQSGQPVSLKSCSESKTSVEAQSIAIDTPAQAAQGDFMLAFISTDGSEQLVEPLGWTAVYESPPTPPTYGIYKKFVGASEPASHSWSISTNEQLHGYILLLENASGALTLSTLSGNSASPTPAPLTTEVADTLVIQATSHDDADLFVDPSRVLPDQFSFFNIIADTSSFNAGAVSSQAVGSWVSDAGTEAPAAQFTLTGVEEWRAVMVGVEPYEFRISMPDTTASVCGEQEVTVSVTDKDGNLVPSFTGQVQLFSSVSGHGAWSDAGALNGSLVGVDSLGLAFYTFEEADNSVAVFKFHSTLTGSRQLMVRQNIPGGTSITGNPLYSPTLVIDDECSYRISVDDGQVGVCSTERVSVSVFDSEGNPGPYVSGDIQFSSALGSSGDYSLFSGSGTLDNGVGGDGVATYTYAPEDQGQVTLAFSDPVLETVNFDVSSPTNPAFAVDPGFDPNLSVLSCELRLSHSGTSDVCSSTAISLAIVEPSGALADNFTGTVTLSNEAGAGSWFVNSAVNGVTNLGNGSVEYSFDLADGGNIVLDFVIGMAFVALDFDASVAQPGYSAPAGGFDPGLAVLNCSVVLLSEISSNVCDSGSTLIVEIRDRFGLPGTRFEGLVTLANDMGNGDYVSASGSGTLSNGSADDGVATYEFVQADAGSVELEFVSAVAGNLSFFTTSPALDFAVAESTETLELLACEFRITHSGSSDICSNLKVTVSVFNELGFAVTDYEGTVNLNTDSGDGSWTNGSGGGSLIDPVANDGSASYEFVLADAGSVELGFTTEVAEALNFNVNDGVSSDSNSAFDPDLLVASCSFRINVTEPQISACSSATVEIVIVNSSGERATDFEGTMQLSTDTLNGDWGLSVFGQGVFSNPVQDDGMASYQFSTLDNGLIVLLFGSSHPGTVNFDIVSGGIGLDGNFDPDLEISSCLPVINNSVCERNQQSATLTVSTGSFNSASKNRMIIMLVYQVGTLTVFDAPTFNGEDMTLIERVQNPAGAGTSIEMWGLLDASLPLFGGSYSGAYVLNGTAVNQPSMCLLELVGVAQEFPLPSVLNPSLGPINSSTSTALSTPQELLTSITTSANNALVLSAGLSDFTTEPNSWFDSSGPNPPMSIVLGGGSDEARPEGGTAVASAGRNPAAGFISIRDTDNEQASNGTAHLVASFNPLIDGPALGEGYEPIELFDTQTGNINYVAIGNSLRTSGLDAQSCDFIDFSQGTTAPLQLPAGAVVRKAYLYWAGSGSTAASTEDSEVDFGPVGAEVPLTADALFAAEGLRQGSDFFAAYKDVSNLITGSGSYALKNLEVQSVAPWDPSLCAGGWSLVVVYEHSNERFRVLNLFHGIQPFRFSEVTLVSRNFRLAPADGQFQPNGQVTHFTLEGDIDTALGIATDEGLGIQALPGSESFTALSNSFQTGIDGADDFNATISRPIYSLNGATGFFEFDATAGINGDGYEADTTTAHGVDVDTHYFSGANPGDILYPYASVPGFEAESLVSRYSTGFDYVLLVSEIVGVSAAEVADIELQMSSSGDFSVNGTIGFEFLTRNNGDATGTGGFADGEILIATQLPPGLTIDSIAADGWNCSTQGGAMNCQFDIAQDCTLARGCAIPSQLAAGETLPVIAVTVSVAGSSQFPLLSNEVKVSGRLIHTGGSCPALAPGLLPAASACDRAPQFDPVFDLQNGAIDINELVDKSETNNNVDSLIVDIRGNLTDLAIAKSAAGSLEQGSNASYELVVTNHGPDATTADVVVRDLQPAGLVFNGAGGAGWSCGLAPLLCVYSASLAVGESAGITLTASVTGPVGNLVTNTASVETSSFDFDTQGNNNAATDISPIVAPPQGANERFLLSVGGPGASAAIGGLGQIENHDFFVYDPALDSGSAFYDNDVEGFNVNEANAVHLFDNGKIALSASSPSTIGTNNVAFEPEDIVVYDPILGTASLLFDGSAVFVAPVVSGPVSVDIDAIYIEDEDRIYFSIAGSLTAAVNINNLIFDVTFNKGDIILYQRGASYPFSVEVFASDIQTFGAEVQVDGLYRRVDETNHNASIDSYVLSIDEDGSIAVAACPTCDPEAGIAVSRDDLFELDATGANRQSRELFFGDRPLGVFTPADNARSIDAIHVVEEGDLGHFSISQSQAGNTCMAGQITISKHAGLTHSVDAAYTGSIRISTDINQGDWSIAAGQGSLDNGALDDGAAIYTFVPGDNGQVTLFFSETTPSSVNVNVSNGLVRESGIEDPNFDFNHVITSITYRDEFNAASFSGQDGNGNWNGPWIEVDDVASGPQAGNIRVDNGRLTMTSSPASSADPAFSRKVDLSTFTAIEDVILRFDYAYEFLNAGSDSLVVEARSNGSAAFSEIHNFAGIGGSNLVPAPLSLNLSSLLGNPVWSDSVEIRFRISSGYTGNSMFFIDNVELSTGTTACGIGDMDHYEIRIDGLTRDAMNPISGIQCVGSLVTITPHTSEHVPHAIAEQIVLQNSQNKGDWSLVAGSGAFDNGGLGDGTATYAFSAGDAQAVFRFNYTDPSNDPELVNFDIGSLYGTHAAEDPTLAVQSAGLLFYDETNNSAAEAFPTQIAGKPSNTGFGSRLITLEAVRTSDSEPDVCLPLVAPGNTLDVEFGLECLDPATCATNIADLNAIEIPVTNDNGLDSAAAYGSVPVEFAVQPNSGHSAAEVTLNFGDVGSVQLHARMDIPLNDDLDGQLSGDKLSGSSNSFVVRPFAFDIDFANDRATNGQTSAASSFADNPDGSVFVRAGEAFGVTVTAVGWQAEDDLDNDGRQDLNGPLSDALLAADLSDNPKTPNYGYESSAGDYQLRLIPAANPPQPAATLGEISPDTFAQMQGGEQTQLLSYSEVGFVDFVAVLVEPSEFFLFAGFLNTPFNYTNGVENVGRFVPDHFRLETAVVNPRLYASANSSCIAPGSYSYLGEAFGVTTTISARNVQGEITRNYTGDFAKLGPSDFGASTFAAVDIQPGPDILHSDRLQTEALTLQWNLQESGGELGMGALNGSLIFNRQGSGAEDGPFLDLGIAFNVMDSDGVGVLLDLDSDDSGSNDLALLDSADFRYGRLRFTDALGPETEPLDIGLFVEHWNGAAFETNLEDSCTVLFYDASQPVASARSFRFVPGSFLEQLVNGDSIIEQEHVLSISDLSISLFEGRNNLQAQGGSSGLDRPLVASAPGEGREGSALLEFDLSSAALPYPLDFLSYDWRTPGSDPLTEDASGGDGDYSDNPWGLLEFNQYRGHDRIINWQEIYPSSD